MKKLKEKKRGGGIGLGKRSMTCGMGFLFIKQRLEKFLTFFLPMMMMMYIEKERSGGRGEF